MDAACATRRARRARRARADRRRASGELVGGEDVASLATTGTTAGGRHAADDAQPVVGLVVEDAGGRRRAASAPTATCTRPSAAPALPTPPASAQRSTPGPAARSPRSARRGARVGGASCSSRRPSPPRSRARRRRPARRAGRAGRSARCAASSQPIVRPPSRHSAFSGPCTLNGMAPGIDGLAEAVDARVAGRVAGAAGTGAIVGAERVESGRAPVDRRRRHEHVERPVDGAAPSVAAASAALPHDAMASGGRSRPRRRPQPLGDEQVQQHPDEVAGLVASRRRCRSRPSPIPHRRRGTRARRTGRRPAPNGVVRKPPPSTVGHRGVELARPAPTVPASDMPLARAKAVHAIRRR